MRFVKLLHFPHANIVNFDLNKNKNWCYTRPQISNRGRLLLGPILVCQIERQRIYDKCTNFFTKLQKIKIWMHQIFKICCQMVTCWFMLLMLYLPLLDICAQDPLGHVWGRGVIVFIRFWNRKKVNYSGDPKSRQVWIYWDWVNAKEHQHTKSQDHHLATLKSVRLIWQSLVFK